MLDRVVKESLDNEMAYPIGAIVDGKGIGQEQHDCLGLGEHVYHY